MTAWKLIAQPHYSTMDPDRGICNSAIEEICIDRRRSCEDSADGSRNWWRWISQNSIGEFQQLLRLWDFRHGGLGEDAGHVNTAFAVSLR